MGKLNKRSIGIVFFVLLCGLVFLSRTVYYYRLPEVSAVKPFRGFLNKMEISSGIADWAELETVYAVVGGTVEAIFVKEGDEVEAGQPLFQMSFDVEAAERRLREIRNNIGKMQRDIEYTTAKLETLTRALENRPEYRTEYRPEYRTDLISLELDNARRTLEEIEFSYEMGGKSRKDLDTARNALTALYLKYESDAAALRFDLAARNSDLSNLLLQEESCLDTLGDYRDYAVIQAPTAGVAASLLVKKGMYVQDKTPALSIGAGGEFTVECRVSPENNFVLPGDFCELSNSSRTLEGVVSRVKPVTGGKTVDVTVRSAEVRPGETFEVIFEKSSGTPYTLVPNAALNQDNDGYFLNLVKRRKGILGEEYYVERLDVYIGDSDRSNTVIVRGVTFFEPMVLRSTGAVVSGDAVFLLNPGDFFE
jgi:biotin carboxyl carrier protein